MFKDITRDDVYRIETQRLWLRWPKNTDAKDIADHLGEKRIADMTGRIKHPYARSDAEAYIFSARNSNSDGHGIALVIAPKPRPNAVIGAIALTREPNDSGELPTNELTLGYWIGVPHWGQGFASEAVLALLSTGFTLTSAEQIIATVKPENTASKRVLAKAGFVETGRETRFMPARNRDEYVDCYALTRKALRDGASWSAYGAAA